MIAVIFEVEPAAGAQADYLARATALRSELERVPGFLSIERFESLTTPGKFVSLQFWRDEECIRKWRNLQQHRDAQAQGRGGVFSGYRLRIASVIRDYTLEDRAQAPGDSVQVHG